MNTSASQRYRNVMWDSPLKLHNHPYDHSTYLHGVIRYRIRARMIIRQLPVACYSANINTYSTLRPHHVHHVVLTPLRLPYPQKPQQPGRKTSSWNTDTPLMPRSLSHSVLRYRSPPEWRHTRQIKKINLSMIYWPECDFTVGITSRRAVLRLIEWSCIVSNHAVALRSKIVVSGKVHHIHHFADSCHVEVHYNIDVFVTCVCWNFLIFCNLWLCW